MAGNSWITSLVQQSLHHEQVARTLERLEEKWNGPGNLAETIASFPLGPDALIHLLAVSSPSAERVVRDPELLPWLIAPEVADTPRSYGAMLAQMRAGGAQEATDNFRALRLWKGRETTRIALREIIGAPIEETTAELSQLAEICLGVVFKYWREQLRTRFGDPGTDFSALGLGKLGGRELNYSSDIDLIFFYGTEGSVSPRVSVHEWHNRLAESIIKTFSQSDPHGALFRIDLRLRPEGTTGPLTRSFESMENYYAGFGETWERLALIKARRVCGSEELGYEFLRQLQPFVFPRNQTPELLEEIAALKNRIERQTTDELNVKLGRGGIREIEFIAQTLQFIHGARHAFLQETSTLKALRAIDELELLPHADIRTLILAYRFLRRLEHRIQIEAERQTHSIPTDDIERRRLALSLGFASADALMHEFARATEGVREIFSRLVSGSTAMPIASYTFFDDRERAERSFDDLAKASTTFHVAPRTRQIFRKLRPLLLGELKRSADPDATLTAVVRFIEAFGLRSLLYELLVANPKFLELLVRMLDASTFATQLLVRHPEMLEEVTRNEDLDRSLAVNDYLRSLADPIGRKDFAALRAFRQARVLRLILRDVLGLCELRGFFSELSDLLEACTLAALKMVEAHDLTVIAMGKFGGRELTYGSDLDLMFVGQDHRAAQELITALSTSSAEGMIASVDARLRPEGENAPLVGTLDAFVNYYRGRAQFWEIQALTRARPIAGAEAERFLAVADASWREAGRDPELFSKIDTMLNRMRAERKRGTDFENFKTGVGGIVEAEFLVQALQMRMGLREPSMFSVIPKLTDALTREEAGALTQAYLFLRHCETTLRRWENNSASALPAEEGEQAKLARRMKFADRVAWQQRYEESRATIHRIYETRITGSA
ncbi:MAG: hypothetical protein M3R59_05790 [Verrucomicrobiota bacterium]|nr:hypothetical protein [Verrucomicrobiota bacterium]